MITYQTFHVLSLHGGQLEPCEYDRNMLDDFLSKCSPSPWTWYTEQFLQSEQQFWLNKAEPGQTGWTITFRWRRTNRGLHYCTINLKKRWCSCPGTTSSQNWTDVVKWYEQSAYLCSGSFVILLRASCLYPCVRLQNQSAPNPKHTVRVRTVSATWRRTVSAQSLGRKWTVELCEAFSSPNFIFQSNINPEKTGELNVVWTKHGKRER